MLKDLLDAKKCFKLVCGAGNEDADDVKKLVTLYAKAGCRFFDLSAKIVLFSDNLHFLFCFLLGFHYFCAKKMMTVAIAKKGGIAKGSPSMKFQR